jgi:hypothetical protein
MFGLKKAPRILQKRTSRMMIRNYQLGARGSYVSEFKIEEECGCFSKGKRADTLLWPRME